jgi:hypothetical protein
LASARARSFARRSVGSWNRHHDEVGARDAAHHGAQDQRQDRDRVPGRIEVAHVADPGIDFVAAAQRVQREVHAQGATGGQRRRLGDNRGQVDRIAPVAVDRVQAGRTAGGVVRLALDRDSELDLFQVALLL